MFALEQGEHSSRCATPKDHESMEAVVFVRKVLGGLCDTPGMGRLVSEFRGSRFSKTLST
jgi:hypothetical protein